MSVPIQDPISTAIGNGTTTAFTFAFLLYATEDLRVSVDGALKTYGADYTVTGLDQVGGGTVTFTAPPVAGAKVSMRRSVMLRRATDYQYAGDFQAKTVNRDFDRLWMASQDNEVLGRNALRFPADEVIDSNLPSAAARALRGLGFDALGNPALTTATDAIALAMRLLDARDSGAVGNNATLNNAAVTLAVAALKQASFPAGTYKMSPGTFGKAGSVIRLEPGARFSTDAGNGALSFADNSGLIGFNEGADGNTWYSGRRFSGARAAGIGAVNAGFSPVAFMYDVRSDSSDVGGSFSVGLESRLVFGGAAAKGGRIGMYGSAEHQDGATNLLNLNRNYVGTQGCAYAQGYGSTGGDGGTAGNEKGAYFGLAGATYVNALAQYVFDATGAEFNTFIGTGTVGLKYSSGISVIGVNAARGTKIDCGIRIAGQSELDSTYTGHIGWTSAFTFTDANGADPIFSGGSVMDTVWMDGAKRTIARGLDFAGFNITNEVLRSGDYMKLTNDHLYLADVGGFATIEPNGPSVNANLLLKGRGTGLVGIGAFTSSGDAAANGYITVCDAAGVPRKLLTTA